MDSMARAERPELKRKPIWPNHGTHGRLHLWISNVCLCQTLLFCVELYCFVSDFIVSPQQPLSDKYYG